ncbi:MAG TPA: hypothetical protein VFC59_01710 [Cryobacterium sp.]|nr:hypothetical protein [Cryobacterium sp.]
MNAAAAKPDRTLIVILAIIGVLVVVALVAVFSRGEPRMLDAATPAGVVQRYAAAVIAGDETAAMAYLTPDLRAQCDRFENASTDNMRITLDSTTERADSADVNVTVVTFFEGGGPFGPTENEVAENFNLVKINGDWFISTTPWDLTICSNSAVK